MKRIKKLKCRNCTEPFIPNYRSVQRQEYCAKDECRLASKSASQNKWQLKNPNYFKGPVHVLRMQEWRRAHPGRSRRKRTAPVLQEICSPIPSKIQDVTPILSPNLPDLSPPAPVLQDFCLAQDPVFVGLIAFFTGCVLQDDIAAMTRRLEQLGHDVRGSTTTPGGYHDAKNPHPPQSHPHHSTTVQLGGSPSGP